MSGPIIKNTKSVLSLSRAFTASLWIGLALLSFGCQQGEEFVSGSLTDPFTQDFNPEYLEVLWVVDDRSPMFNARTRVVNEATKFFSTIDSITARYRMGIVSTDMQFAQGALQPRGSRLILNEGFRQTPSERATVFGGLLSDVINLKTGYAGRGLEAAVTALEGEFNTQPNVPLVLIFISFGDDESSLPGGATDAVDYFKNKFVELKGGKQDLVRTYAVNYKPLPSGVNYNTPESEPYRCAQLYNNEIDISPASYEDRYFGVVNALNGYTADLCTLTGFASQMNLAGLTLKELPKNFMLRNVPNVNTLKVSIFRKDGSAAPIPPWAYNTTTNEIVFATTPEQGTTILVQYLPAGK
jgi:hypothetical protein